MYKINRNTTFKSYYDVGITVPSRILYSKPINKINHMIGTIYSVYVSIDDRLPPKSFIVIVPKQVC